MSHIDAGTVMPSTTRFAVYAAEKSTTPSDIANSTDSDFAFSTLLSKYRSVRSMTRSLAAKLSAEDQMVQSCADASPVKWHQAHTTWFFETFVLRPFLSGYKPFREEFHRLFNSYYISLGGEIPEKRLRSSFSRPSLEEVIAFREHVDRGIEELFTHSIDEEISRRVVLGLSHEQQHQELALTDIKHAFFSNPLRPTYQFGSLPKADDDEIPELLWLDFKGGLTEIGDSPDPDVPLDFCFDNETPRHRVYLQPFRIASRNVTCREYLEFMSDAMRGPIYGYLTDGRSRSELSGKRRSIGNAIQAIAPVGGFSLSGDGMASQACWILPFAMLVSSRPTPLRSGVPVDFLRKPNGNQLQARGLYEGIFLNRVRSTRRRQMAPAASSNYSATAGNGRLVRIPAIRDTNLSGALWVNITPNLCPLR